MRKLIIIFWFYRYCFFCACVHAFSSTFNPVSFRVSFCKRISSFQGRHAKNDSLDDIKPPSSFDPSVFDHFDDGGWSTNINNPYVAARYVKALQTTNQAENSLVEARTQMNRKREQERKYAWIKARKDEEAFEERQLLERLRIRDEQAIMERRHAWERARLEEGKLDDRT